MVIGARADAEPVTELSPADWEDSFFDQGEQARAGYARNRAWNIEVARAGEYEFELRRGAYDVYAERTPRWNLM